MALVSFKAGTLSSYTSASKDENTLYFITDAKKIFKGTVDVTESIIPVNSFPSFANAYEGKLYINASTLEVKTKVSGESDWTVLVPGYVTDEDDVVAANNDKIPTVEAVRGYVADQLATITGGTTFVQNVTFDSTNIALNVDKGDSSPTSVALTGVVSNPTYNSSTLTLTLPRVGTTDLVVNIPKDNFVRSGRYEASYTLPDSSTGAAIVLVVNDGTNADMEVVIPAADLVDVYTGTPAGSTDDVAVTVSSGNVITASVVVDPANDNRLTSSSTGLMVDVSDKADILGSSAETHVLIGSSTGNLEDSGKTINDSGVLGDLSTEIPTANIIAAAIAAPLASGNDDEVIISTTTGIQRSGVYIGGSILDSSPSEYTLATESAVDVAVSGKADLIASADRPASEGKVLIATSGGAFESSGVEITAYDSTNYTAMLDSNSAVPTEKLVSDAIDAKAENILGSGTANQIVTSTTTGVQRSGKTIGGSTLANSPDSDTLATEAAVSAAVSPKATKLASYTASDVLVASSGGDIADSGKTIGGATLAGTPSSSTLATEAAVDAAITAAISWGAIS